MNVLALASRGYLCDAGVPLVTSLSPETVAVSLVPDITVDHIPAPRTVGSVSPPNRPVTRPKRRR